MIHLRMRSFSESLGFHVSTTVLLPQEPRREPVPVLWLLHGASDDDTSWHSRTGIERYAEAHGIAVVMPFGGLGYYSNERVGFRWWDWVSDELPALVQRNFKISDAREDTFVAGLSMGGFGTLKLALNQPHRFAAAASLSGALVMDSPRNFSEEYLPRTSRIWGESGIEPGGPDDLCALVARTPATDLPRLYLACGTEDYLVEENRQFEQVAAAAGVPLTTSFEPGDHDWAFWDDQIQRVLAWLPIRSS